MEVGRMDDKEVMRLVIEKTKEGILKGQSPFGACIVKDGKIISIEHNTVWAECDPTAHAEINAIRSASKKLNTIDLSGCIIYSTTEPCPMCFSAIHWAKIKKIVFGTRIEDAKRYGFNELPISNEKMRELSNNGVEIVGDVLREENLELFELWKKNNGKAY